MGCTWPRSGAFCSSALVILSGGHVTVGSISFHRLSRSSSRAMIWFPLTRRTHDMGNMGSARRVRRQVRSASPPASPPGESAGKSAGKSRMPFSRMPSLSMIPSQHDLNMPLPSTACSYVAFSKRMGIVCFGESEPRFLSSKKDSSEIVVFRYHLRKSVGDNFKFAPSQMFSVLCCENLMQCL